MFRTNVVEKIKTYILCPVTLFFQKRTVYEIMWKIIYSWIGHRWKYGGRALHAVYLRLQTHTHNMYYTLLFHCNIGRLNAPQSHVIHTVPVLLWFHSFPSFHLKFPYFNHSKQRRTTVGRIPLDEWSARRRDLYLTTHNTHNRQTSMPPGEIWTHDLSRRAVADLRLRRRGHWDRLYTDLGAVKIIFP
jgi:hypothetical protein